MTKSSRTGCVALALFGALACDTGPVSKPTWHIAEAELARSAKAGYPARIVVGEPRGSVSRRGAETVLVLGATSARVLPSPALEPFVAGGFERYLNRVWVAPYLAVSDYDGAVRAAVRGYTHALEDQKLLEKGVPLPPIPDPNAWGYQFPSRNTDWGVPLSATVFALAVALDRFAKKKG